MIIQFFLGGVGIQGKESRLPYGTPWLCVGLTPGFSLSTQATRTCRWGPRPWAILGSPYGRRCIEECVVDAYGFGDQAAHLLEDGAGLIGAVEGLGSEGLFRHEAGVY